MSTFFVASGGSNTSPYDTWAKAATSLAAALALATADDDIVVVQHNAVPSVDAELTATTTYTIVGNILLVSASNDGGSAWTPTPMGTSNWIGTSTGTNRAITLASTFRARVYGLTLRIATTGSAVSMSIGGGGATDGAHLELEDCYLWQGHSNAGSTLGFGNSTSNYNSYVKLKNCTLRIGFGSTPVITLRQAVEFEGCTLSPDGSAPTTALFSVNVGSGLNFKATGCDFSHAGASALLNSAGSTAIEATFDRCKLGSGFSLLAAQTPANKSSARVTVIDCANGDTHGFFGYADALGMISTDSSIYMTGTPAAASWKIVTTASASRYTPFVTPWMSVFWDDNTPITPRLEVLRDGSTTPYTDAQVWADFLAKITSGSARATLASDGAGLTASGTNQATGVGAGSWTGPAGSAWSGKLEAASSLTLAEAGDLSARVCVGVPSATVYVDPFIRS